MPRLNPAVELYIDLIKQGEEFTEIHLAGKQVTDLDVTRLMGCLVTSPLAPKITALYFSDNKLTILPPGLTKLTGLLWVHLDTNPLTEASKIALQSFSTALITIVSYDGQRQMPANARLNQAVLDSHFIPKSEVTPDDVIAYIKKIGAVRLLAYLPIDLIRMLNQALLPVAVRRMRVDMDNFIDLFSLARPGFDNSESRDVLNDYHRDSFDKQITKIENHYTSVLSCNILQSIVKLNKFIKDHGFNHDNLLQKNNKGYTPLALAMQQERELAAKGVSSTSIVTPILRRITPDKVQPKAAVARRYSNRCCVIS